MATQLRLCGNGKPRFSDKDGLLYMWRAAERCANEVTTDLEALPLSTPTAEWEARCLLVSNTYQSLHLAVVAIRPHVRRWWLA